MKVLKRFAAVTLLVSIALSTGCGTFKQNKFYVLDGRELVMLSKGESMTAAFQGIFLSDYYAQKACGIDIDIVNPE